MVEKSVVVCDAGVCRTATICFVEGGGVSLSWEAEDVSPWAPVCQVSVVFRVS